MTGTPEFLKTIYTDERKCEHKEHKSKQARSCSGIGCAHRGIAPVDTIGPSTNHNDVAFDGMAVLPWSRNSEGGHLSGTEI